MNLLLQKGEKLESSSYEQCYDVYIVGLDSEWVCTHDTVLDWKALVQSLAATKICSDKGQTGLSSLPCHI